MTEKEFDAVRNDVLRLFPDTTYTINYAKGNDVRPILDDDGSFLYNPLEDLPGEILGICGCGKPDVALDIYKRALEWAEKSVGSRSTNPFEDNEELSVIMLYTLAEKDFTEHGSSVYGSRLTEKGKILLKVLRMKLDGKEQK